MSHFMGFLECFYHISYSTYDQCLYCLSIPLLHSCYFPKDVGVASPQFLQYFNAFFLIYNICIDLHHWTHTYSASMTGLCIIALESWWTSTVMRSFPQNHAWWIYQPRTSMLQHPSTELSYAVNYKTSWDDCLCCKIIPSKVLQQMTYYLVDPVVRVVSLAMLH